METTRPTPKPSTPHAVGRVVPNPPPRDAPTPPRLPERQRLFHSPPPWVKSGAIFFVTICCAKRKTNQLAHPEVFTSMSGAFEHYARQQQLWTHLFLAMPDHVHGLFSFPREERMEKLIRDWKRYIARQTGVQWQDGFFDHRLRDDENYEHKAHYIRTNPVRGGLVSAAEIWPYVWEPADVAAR